MSSAIPLPPMRNCIEFRSILSSPFPLFRTINILATEQGDRPRHPIQADVGWWKPSRFPIPRKGEIRADASALSSLAALEK